MTDEELTAARATIQRGVLLPPGTDSETLMRMSQLLQAANTLLAEVERCQSRYVAAEGIAKHLSDYLGRLSIENARLRAQINGTVDEDA